MKFASLSVQSGAYLSKWSRAEIRTAAFVFGRMSAINITNVAVLDNPASFLSPFQFEISYECVASLKDDLEWKLIYVGSAEDETYDQLLESVLVGPVNVGNYRFVLQADPPDPSKIREEDIIGVTVLLLTCSYLGQEFVRVGYYVNNDYDDEQLREEPPQKVLIDKIQRNILSDKPRVTKFPFTLKMRLEKKLLNLSILLKQMGLKNKSSLHQIILQIPKALKHEGFVFGTSSLVGLCADSL